jgi:N utilization substance protein A
MNGADLLRGVDFLSRERNISKDVIFSSIEKAVRLAINKRYEDENEDDVVVSIDRQTGAIVAQKGDTVLTPDELGRIAAQSAKQLMIQNFREEESNAVLKEYSELKGDLVYGTVQRFDGGAATVSLGKAEAILPRGEQIPGETHHVGERVKAIVLEVRKQGHRVRIILSRTHPDFVRRLFENEIPEIQDRTIEIRAVAREAGYRSKVAVSSIDMKVDCVGACVGVRGSRIKNIVDELGGERIDIVRWNDSLQVLIPNALQPAAIEEVFLYPRLGRAIVLVKEDQLSLAIGRRGQNVRLASKLVGWDIEIMTHDELNEGIERAEGWFLQIPGITPEQVEAFIEEGFLSYADLTFLEPAELGELSGLTEEQAEDLIAFAEEAAERVEEEERAAREAAAAAGETQQPPVSAAQAKAARLFSEPLPGPTPASAARQTFESLFGPDTPAAEPTAEAPPGPEQVFAEAPAGEAGPPAAAEGAEAHGEAHAEAHAEGHAEPPAGEAPAEPAPAPEAPPAEHSEATGP